MNSFMIITFDITIFLYMYAVFQLFKKDLHRPTDAARLSHNKNKNKYKNIYPCKYKIVSIFCRNFLFVLHVYL